MKQSIGYDSSKFKLTIAYLGNFRAGLMRTLDDKIGEIA